MTTPTTTSRPPRRGFTLIELLTVIAIVGVLAGILVPTVMGVRHRAKQAACSSNLRQIASAFLLYAGEHDGKLPDFTTYNWGGRYTAWGGPRTEDRPLYPYISDMKVFQCPGDIGTADSSTGNTPLHIRSGNSYAVANSGQRGVLATSAVPGVVTAIERPAKTILVFDATALNSAGWTYFWHPGDRSNVAMVDGHVEVFSREIVRGYTNPTNPPGYTWGWSRWSGTQ